MDPEQLQHHRVKSCHPKTSPTRFDARLSKKQNCFQMITPCASIESIYEVAFDGFLLNDKCDGSNHFYPLSEFKRVA